MVVWEHEDPAKAARRVEARVYALAHEELCEEFL